MKITAIYVLILAYKAGSDCCRDCSKVSDNGCLKCSKGVLTDGICNEFCPSGYLLIDSDCKKILTSLFSISFSNPVSLLANEINDWHTVDYSQFIYPNGNSTLPTKYRPFYFNHKSLLESFYEYQPSPIFNFQIWINMIEAGLIINSKSILLEYYNNLLEFAVILKSQSNQRDNKGKLTIVTMQNWNFIRINIYQSSFTEVTIEETLNKITVSDSESSYDSSIWTIGGFSGFIYFVSCENGRSEYVQEPFIPICGPAEYWNGNTCEKCNESCPKWPWCINNSDCSICSQSYCSCTGYSNLHLTDCRRNLLLCPVTFLLVNCLTTCPTMYSSLLTICTISDNSQVTVTFYSTSTNTFSDTSNYFSFHQLPGMLNAYNRGAYFDGSSSYMQTTTSFQFSPICAIMLWIYPMNTKGHIFTKYNIFKLGNSATGIYFQVGATLVQNVALPINNWYAVLITVTIPLLNAPIYTFSIHGYADVVHTGGVPIIDTSNDKTYLAYDLLFNGYIYEFSYWPSLALSPSISSATDVCVACVLCSIYPKTLGQCLIPCSINYYYSTSCKACSSGCSACIYSSSCTLNIDPLCNIASGYITCTACKANAFFNPTACSCLSNYVYQSSDQTCCNSLCTSCSGDPIFCSTCTLARVNGVCLSTCPSLYTVGASAICNLADTDGSIIWNFQVASNIIYDTSANPSGFTLKTFNAPISPAYHPFLDNNFDPIPGLNRGLHFDGNNLMYCNSFIISSIHSWVIWFNPTTATLSEYGLVTKAAQSFGIYYKVGNAIYINYYLFSKTIGVLQCSISSSLNSWYLILVTVNILSTDTTISCSINQGTITNSITYTKDYIVDTSATLSVGSGNYQGWIYQISYFISFISTASISSLYNGIGGPAGFAGTLGLCAPSFYENIIGNCINCNAGCITCINSDSCEVCSNKFCYSCYDYTTNLDCVACPNGQTFVDAGKSCVSCLGQCSICWKVRIDTCSTCSGSFRMSAEGVCLATCPVGFSYSISSCLNTLSQTHMMSYIFNIISNTIYDTFNNIPIFMGLTTAFFPNYEISDPRVLTNRGLYFTGSSFATIGNSATATNYAFVGNTHSFDLWICPFLVATTGTVLSYSGISNSYMTLSIIPIVNAYNIIVEYTLASTANPGLTTNIILGSNSNLFMEWVSITWTFSFVLRIININLYVNQILSDTQSTTDYILYETMPTTFTIGYLNNALFFQGYLYSLDIYSDVIVATGRVIQCLNCSTCTYLEDCLSICLPNEFSSSVGCTACLGSCTNGCASGSDCSLHPDPLCNTYTILKSKSCDSCIQYATHNGVCQCLTNFQYNALLDTCECIPNYSLTNGQCIKCISWVQSSDIVANYSNSYLQIFFNFTGAISPIGLTCDEIFLSVSLSLFGTGYLCNYNSDNTIIILTLGTNPLFSSGILYIKSGLLSFTANQCGFLPTNISVNISINNVVNIKASYVSNSTVQGVINIVTTPVTEIVYYPTAIIDAPDLVLYECNNLVISGLQSSGSLARLLLYKWSVLSTPDNPLLSVYNTDYQANTPSFIIPSNSLFNSTIIIELTVKNFLNYSNTISKTIISTNSTQILIANYDSSISHEFIYSNWATFLIHAYRCKPINDIKVNWQIMNITNNYTEINEKQLWSAQVMKELFVIPPYTIPANSLVYFLFTITDLEYNSTGSAVLMLHAIDIKPMICVNIANGTFYGNNVLSINSSVMLELNTDYQLDYTWRCITNKFQICTDIIVNSTSNILKTIQNGLIMGTDYYFLLNINQSQIGFDQEFLASKVILLKMVEEELPIIKIYDAISKGQPYVVQNFLPLVLIVELNETQGNFQYSWTSLTNRRILLLSPLNQPSLSIDTSSLFPGGHYLLQLTIIINNTKGIYTYEFITNSPPQLGTLAISSTTGIEFSTIFNINAIDYIDIEDNYPLTYAFGYLDRGYEIMLHLKNQSSFYFTMLPYTDNNTQIFVRIYDSLGCSAIYIKNINLELNQNYNQQDYLNNVEENSNSIFFDPQTIPGIVSLLSMASLNREYTLQGEFILQNNSQIQLLQEVFDYCINQINQMINDITFYNHQGINAVSSALLLISKNPNLETTANMETIINIIKRFLSYSDSIYGLQIDDSINFLNSIYNLASINDSLLFVYPSQANTFISATETIIKSTIKRMGLGETNNLIIGNSTLDIYIVNKDQVNNMTIVSSIYKNSYVQLPHNLSSILPPNTANTLAISLTTIQQDLVSNFNNNLNSLKPATLVIDIIDKNTLETISISLGTKSIIISIPIFKIPLNMTANCIFLNTSTNTWSEDGCTLLSIESNSIICSCNHLSAFSAKSFFEAGGSTAENTNGGSAFNISVLNEINLVNALGLYVFCGLFLIYALLACYMRRLDNETYDSKVYATTFYTVRRSDSIDEDDAKEENNEDDEKKKKNNMNIDDEYLSPDIQRSNIIHNSFNLNYEENKDRFDYDNSLNHDESMKIIEIDKLEIQFNEKEYINKIEEENEKECKNEGKGKKETDNCIESEPKSPEIIASSANKSVRELFIESHEVFRLIYHPNMTESRITTLSLLWLKIVLQMYLIGLFYQIKTKISISFNNITSLIKSYSVTDFWIVIYSTLIAYVIITLITYLLKFEISEFDSSKTIKEKKNSSKRKRILGYIMMWMIFIFCGWSITLFSIKFSTMVRATWILSTLIGAIFDIIIASLLKEFALALVTRLFFKFIKIFQRNDKNK